MRTITSAPSIPNLQASINQFFARGGFVNGLNPQVTGRIWYVNANDETDRLERKGPVGSDSNSGLSPLQPFATVARAFEFVDCYDIIMVSGVIREQLTAPLGVFDVTIFGAANTPRQSTSSGVPTGGGSTWLAPTSPTASTPLLLLREQGWRIGNIMFGTVANTATIQLRCEESATYPDASHAQIVGNYFATQSLAGEVAIGDYGGMFNCRIIGNIFNTIAGTAILGQNVSIRTPNQNLVDSNFFRNCGNAIDWPMNYGIINNNRFKDITTKQIDVNSGQDNFVGINFFDKTQANISIAEGFIGNASDIWRNYSSDTAALTVGVPA